MTLNVAVRGQEYNRRKGLSRKDREKEMYSAFQKTVTRACPGMIQETHVRVVKSTTVIGLAAGCVMPSLVPVSVYDQFKPSSEVLIWEYHWVAGSVFDKSKDRCGERGL